MSNDRFRQNMLILNLVSGHYRQARAAGEDVVRDVGCKNDDSRPPPPLMERIRRNLGGQNSNMKNSSQICCENYISLT